MESGIVSAHLDGNVLAMLKKIAADEDRSVSWLVGYAVKQLIADRVKVQDVKVGASLQTQLEDAIAAAVKGGPVVTTAEKQAQHRKNLAARAVRMADRAAKRK